jgi:hypothetical protein
LSPKLSLLVAALCACSEPASHSDAALGAPDTSAADSVHTREDAPTIDAAASVGSPAPVPVASASPEEVAHALMSALRTRDVRTLRRYAPPGVALEMGDRSADDPLLRELFDPDGARMRAVLAWSGSVEETRRLGDRWLVRLGPPVDGEVAVLVLQQRDGVWVFDDLRTIAAARFSRAERP